MQPSVQPTRTHQHQNNIRCVSAYQIHTRMRSREEIYYYLCASTYVLSR